MKDKFLWMFLIFVLLACKENKNELKDLENMVMNNPFQKIKSVDSILVKVDLIENSKQPKDSLLAKFYYQAGMRLYQLSEYQMGKEFFSQAQDLYTQNKMPKKAIQMLSNQAVLTEIEGDYSKAIHMYLEALQYYQEIQDSTAIAKVFANLGVLYEEMEFPKKAIYYHQKAILVRQLTKDSIGLAKVYNNIGVLYEELLKEDDSALLYYQKALPIFKIKSKSKAATTYNNIAKILINQKKYSLAEEYLNKAVFWSQEEANSSNIKAHLLRNFGELYIAQKKYDKAKEALVQCYQLFSANGERKKVLEVYSLLSQLSYYRGEYILAATYMTRYTNLKDTLLSIENRKLVTQIEGQYQLQEKNKAIEMLKLKNLANQRKINLRNIITFSIISILLLIIALFYLYFRKEKLVQSQMRLELQNYLLEINHYKQAIEVNNKQKEELSRNRFKEFELTEREGDILLKIAQGLTNAEIAEALFLSTNTIKTHIKNIYIKLDVKNRVEAVRRIN